MKLSYIYNFKCPQRQLLEPMKRWNSLGKQIRFFNLEIHG